MAIAGELMVKMAADIAQLREGVRNAEALMTGFADSLKRIGEVVGLTALAKQFTDFAIDATRGAAALEEQSQQIGVNVEALQAYRAAGMTFGVTTEQMDTALSKFSVSVGKAAEGNKKLHETFDRIGVSLTDAQGKLKPTEQLLQESAKGILGLSGAAERSAAAVELFSRGGIKMISVLGELSQPMKDLVESAKQQGLIVSDVAVTAWDRFYDTLDITKQRLRVFVADGLAPIVPSLEGIMAGIERFATGTMKLIKDIWDALPDWVKDALRFIVDQLVIFAQETARLPEMFTLMWDDIKIAWETGKMYLAEFQVWYSQLFVDMQKPVVEWLNSVVDNFSKLAAELNAWVMKLPEGLRKKMGIETGVIEPFTMHFEVVGTKALDDAEAALAAINARLEYLRTNRILQEILIGMPSGDHPLTGEGPWGTPPTRSGGGTVTAPRDGGKGYDWQAAMQRASDAYEKSLEKLNETFRQMSDPTYKIREQLVQLEEAFARGGISATQYELDFAHLQRKLEEAADSGVTQRIHDLYGKDMVDALKGAERQLISFGDTIFDSFTAGTVNIREFVANFLREIAKMVFQMIVWTPIIRGFMSLIRGWLAGPSGAAGGFAQTGGGRATGGSVFPGMAYDVGEFGRERFIPSVPGRIEPMRKSGGDVTVNIDLGGATSSQGGDAQQTAELGRRLRAAVLDVIRNEKRPGGTLATSASGVF